MLKELIGPDLYRKCLCCLCCVILVIVGVFAGWMIVTQAIAVKIAG